MIRVSQTPNIKCFGSIWHFRWITSNMQTVCRFEASQLLKKHRVKYHPAFMVQAFFCQFSESLPQLYWHVSIIHVQSSLLMGVWHESCPAYASAFRNLLYSRALKMYKREFKFFSSYIGVLVVTLTTKSRQKAHQSFSVCNLSLWYYTYKGVNNTI
jgi:hypothetical protein